MRAPVAFVVTRHLIGHPEDGPTELSRHCHLERSSATKALKRLRENGIATEAELLAHLIASKARPHWQTFTFHLPNPDNWLRAAEFDHWLTGEAAAEEEGLDLVPSNVETYLRREDIDEAMRVVKQVFGKAAALKDANLILHITDPWMHLEHDEPLIERGQRLFDQARNKNVQFAKEFARIG